MSIDSLPLAATAIPIGIAFGVVLERAGLGDSRVIRGQLTGTDFTVILVMFGAIVTAMLGLLWGDALGVVSMGDMAAPPTDLAAQAVGAIVFGGGFAIAALCPGTACVAAASGRRDGIAAVAGVFGGTLVTPALWPALGVVAEPSPDERRFLWADLGVPIWSIAVALVLFAIAARMFVRWKAPRPSARPWWHPTVVETVGLTLAIAYAGVESRPTSSPVALASLAGEIAREEDHVDVLDLAQWIREGRRDLRVIDVREGVDTGTYVIPGPRSSR
jgi:hypothetical protein